jgi:hypothetical protein
MENASSKNEWIGHFIREADPEANIGKEGSQGNGHVRCC